jgi:DNA invertase Pin-like site-specific DNA recombinase
VSTDKQADEGISLEVQEAQCRAYAGLYNLEIIAVIADPGQSAKSLARQGLTRALAMLAGGEAAGLLVSKLDRLTRSVRDLGALIEGPFATAALLSVSEQIDTRSAGGRLVLNVLASVSQWEREAIGERTASAMQHMRAAGKYTGGRARYGYRVGDDGLLVSDESEQATIARVREIRATTRLPLRSIGERLAREGRLSRHGKTFAAQQIAGMLTE